MAKERVPFAEGLFVEDNGGALLAGKCGSCGRVFFPQRPNCLNCWDEELEGIRLESRPRLYTFTAVQMPVHKYAPPFTLAWVEFPEGARVMSQIRNEGDLPLEIGMEMRIVIDRLWEEEDREVIGYMFEPVG
jgi:uncharacterized OB-fold protein